DSPERTGRPQALCLVARSIARTRPAAAWGRSAVIFATKAFFIFLSTVLVTYYLTSRRSHKYTLLLFASWLFYTWVPPHYLWVMLLLTGVDYVAGRQIERSQDNRVRQLWLTASVFANLGLLFAFKYTGFVFDNLESLAQLLGVPFAERTWRIVLPLG